MQEQSLKVRLSQLKKASLELKSRIFNEHRVDSSTVTDILSSVMQSHLKIPYPTALPQALSDIQNKSNQRPPSNNSLSYSPNSSIFMIPLPQRAQQLAQWNSRTSSNESFHSRQGIELQVDKLRNQNDEIENKLAGLSQQISKLRTVQSQRSQQSWKQNLPFINQQAFLPVFITRLDIKQYDFDKIDFQNQRVELMNDKLIISIENKPSKIYKISNLIAVIYINNNRIRLEMRQEEVQYIYFLFKNEKERKIWDLALYVNFKIIENKDLDKNMFLEEVIQSKLTYNRSKSSLKLSDSKEEKLQIKSSDKGQKRRKQSMRYPEKKIDKSDSRSSKIFQNSDKLHQYTLNGNSPQSPSANHITQSARSLSSSRSKQFKELMIFGDMRQSHHESRANTSKFNANQINFESLEENQIQSFPSPFSNKQQQQKKRQQQSLWEKALRELKDGYYFTKYAKNGFKPHNKKIFINNEEQMLICANSENQNQRKAIALEKIRTVKYPAIDQGVRKHVKNARVQNFCVIEYETNNGRKVLEFGCQKIVFIKRFSQQLREFLTLKGLLIND